MKARFLNLFTLVALALSGLTAIPQTVGFAQGGSQNTATAYATGVPRDAQGMKALLPYLSGHSALAVARDFGFSEIGGKKLSQGMIAGADQLVSGSSTHSENEPSIAVDPDNGNFVVEVNHYYSNSGGSISCYAQASYDGGNSFLFDDAVLLPLLDAGDCSDPVVRYSPDGAIVYYAYLDIAPGGSTASMLVSRANGGTPTTLLGSPYAAIVSFGGAFVDKPWIDVAPYGSNSSEVYFSATYFAGSDCDIAFVSSNNYGASGSYDDLGSPGLAWLIAGEAENCATVNQGSRSIGTSGAYNNMVTLCWYNSEADGFLNGVFDIRCAVNTNHGIHGFWDPTFSAVNNQKYELPQFLAPCTGSVGNYERIMVSMFPALTTDPSGMIYIAYSADPTINHCDVEDGNVYLARNFPLSTGWSTPLAVGSSPAGSTQIFPAVSARFDARTNKYVVYVSYMSTSSSNKFYDVYYRRGVRSPGSTSISFSGTAKVTDLTSFSDHYFMGDYFDSALNQRRYWITWTDRSDVSSVNDPDTDTMVDWFLP